MVLRKRLVAALGVVTIAFPAALQAQSASGLPAPVDDAERAALPSIIAMGDGRTHTVAELDALLAKFPRPTPLRGLVQIMRAEALLNNKRPGEAMAAAQEAGELYPNNALMLLMMTNVFLFSGAPQRAAQMWLEASVIDPELVRQAQDDYDANALVGRLDEMGDRKLAARLLTRMDEIGLVGANPPARSERAEAALRAAFDRGGAEAARSYVSRVIDPADLIPFAVDDTYRPLWPAVEQWAGERFVPLRRRYLEALRREWQRQRNDETAVDYARALSGAGAHQAVIDLFLPRLAGNERFDPHRYFLAPVVARSLASVGRAPEAMAMLRRLDVPGEIGSEGMALNVSAAIVNLAFMLQDWATTEQESARWLKLATPLKSQINRSAVLQIAVRGACAQMKLGKANVAAPVIAEVTAAQTLMPSTALTLLACSDNLDDARKLIVNMLATPGDDRGQALLWMQPDDVVGTLPEERLEAAFMQRLQTDPVVMAAARKVGRILPYSVGATMPPGFDPMLMPSAPPPLNGI